jgi:protein-tyrosine-phosphatase
MYVTEGKGKIIFVCYGNIMRSPLAAEFSKIFVQNTELNFTVESFGFHLNENRTSPKICQSVAASLGIDLSVHRSRRLLQKHISDKDIIFIFDHHNQEKLDKFYDVENVFNLAEFIPLGMGKYRAIDDPYGHGEEAVHKCYSLIIEALKAIFESYLSLK